MDRGGNYWRCFTGLALTGAMVTLPVGVLYALKTDALYGLALGLSGALKAPAYMIGWFIHEHFRKIHPTKIGEILTGLFSYGVLAWGLF